MNTFNDFLKKNPELLSKYVSLGLEIVDKAVVPLNIFMQHLLKVQGISPSAKPGELYKKMFNKAVDTPKLDKEDYSESFDFSPVIKAFEKTSDRLKHLNLTKEQFKKLTDLNNIPDVVVKSDPLKDLKAFMSNPSKEKASEVFKRLEISKPIKKGVFRRVKSEG